MHLSWTSHNIRKIKIPRILNKTAILGHYFKFARKMQVSSCKQHFKYICVNKAAVFDFKCYTLFNREKKLPFNINESTLSGNCMYWIIKEVIIWEFEKRKFNVLTYHITYRRWYNQFETIRKIPICFQLAMNLFIYFFHRNTNIKLQDLTILIWHGLVQANNKTSIEIK